MGEKTNIEWTRGLDGKPGSTWNVITGCSKVSTGCKFCYAERLWPRVYGDRPFTDLRFHEDRLEMPLGWKRPRMIFVNSLSDLYHERVTVAEIRRVFDVMLRADWHIFQILTKRTERAAKVLADEIGPLPRHIWQGFSAENQETFDRRVGDFERVRYLLPVLWVSAEPLLGPIDMTLYLGADIDPSDGNREYPGLDWVVAGGESGPQARPMNPNWARMLRDQCRSEGVAFYMKQMGGRRSHNDIPIPEDLKIREYPQYPQAKNGLTMAAVGDITASVNASRL